MASIPWISRNPAADIQNLSYQTPMADANFEDICRRIIHVINLSSISDSE